MVDTIFPDISPDIIVEDTQDVVEYGKETSLILVDGEVQVLEGIEALKVWIEKNIRTARYRWPAYTWDYGTELDDLIGLSVSNDVLEREFERVIKEALSIDKRISEIKDFKASVQGDNAVVEFTVVTFDGQTLEVSSNV